MDTFPVLPTPLCVTRSFVTTLAEWFALYPHPLENLHINWDFQNKDLLARFCHSLRRHGFYAVVVPYTLPTPGLAVDISLLAKVARGKRFYLVPLRQLYH